MYAQVRFVQREGLSRTYDYNITKEIADKLEPWDYVVIESARSDYSVGVFESTSETVIDPAIVTKSVVQKVNVPGYNVPILR